MINRRLSFRSCLKLMSKEVQPWDNEEGFRNFQYWLVKFGKMQKNQMKKQVFLWIHNCSTQIVAVRGKRSTSTNLQLRVPYFLRGSIRSTAEALSTPKFTLCHCIKFSEIWQHTNTVSLHFTLANRRFVNPSSRMTRELLMTCWMSSKEFKHRPMH